MTGLFSRTGSRRGKKAGASSVAAVVCLVLLAVLAIVQVAHIHPVDTDGDHCPLCIVMHSAAPLAVAAILILLVRVGTPEPVFAVRAAVQPYWHPSLFIRPPPQG